MIINTRKCAKTIYISSKLHAELLLLFLPGILLSINYLSNAGFPPGYETMQETNQILVMQRIVSSEGKLIPTWNSLWFYGAPLFIGPTIVTHIEGILLLPFSYFIDLVSLMKIYMGVMVGLSGVFMYYAVSSITKDKRASFLSGFLYELSLLPFVEHILWGHSQFMLSFALYPLLFSLLIKETESRELLTSRTIILGFLIGFTVIEELRNTVNYMLFVLLPLFIYCILVQGVLPRRVKRIKFMLIKGIIIFATALPLILFWIYPFYERYLDFGISPAPNVGPYNLDWALPLSGDMMHALSHSITIIGLPPIIESLELQGFLPGLTLIILVLSGLMFTKRLPYRPVIVVSLLLSFWYFLGPYAPFYSLFNKMFNLPFLGSNKSPYRTLLNIDFLSSYIIGLYMSEKLARTKTKLIRRQLILRRIIVSCIIIFIIFPSIMVALYANNTQYTVPESIDGAYKAISKDTSHFSILQLPLNGEPSGSHVFTSPGTSRPYFQENVAPWSSNFIASYEANKHDLRDASGGVNPWLGLWRSRYYLNQLGYPLYFLDIKRFDERLKSFINLRYLVIYSKLMDPKAVDELETYYHSVYKTDEVLVVETDNPYGLVKLYKTPTYVHTGDAYRTEDTLRQFNVNTPRIFSIDPIEGFSSPLKYDLDTIAISNSDLDDFIMSIALKDSDAELVNIGKYVDMDGWFFGDFFQPGYGIYSAFTFYDAKISIPITISENEEVYLRAYCEYREQRSLSYYVDGKVISQNILPQDRSGFYWLKLENLTQRTHQISFVRNGNYPADLNTLAIVNRDKLRNATASAELILKNFIRSGKNLAIFCEAEDTLVGENATYAPQPQSYDFSNDMSVFLSNGAKSSYGFKVIEPGHYSIGIRYNSRTPLRLEVNGKIVDLPIHEELKTEYAEIQFQDKGVYSITLSSEDADVDAFFISTNTLLTTFYEDSSETLDANMTSISSNKVQFITNSTEPLLAVFSQSYFPGWKISIDDEQVESIIVNGMFIGTYIPKGSHVITVRYISRSNSFLILILIELSLLVIMVLKAKFNKKRVGHHEVSEHARFTLGSLNIFTRFRENLWPRKKVVEVLFIISLIILGCTTNLLSQHVLVIGDYRNNMPYILLDKPLTATAWSESEYLTNFFIENVEWYDILVIVGDSNFSQYEQVRIRDFVRGGGHLLVLKADYDRYILNEFYSNSILQDLLPIKSTSQTRHKTDVIKGYATEEKYNIPALYVLDYITNIEVSNDSRVIYETENRDPLIIERQYGNGRVTAVLFSELFDSTTFRYYNKPSWNNAKLLFDAVFREKIGKENP